jgi:hypothetical protein
MTVHANVKRRRAKESRSGRLHAAACSTRTRSRRRLKVPDSSPKLASLRPCIGSEGDAGEALQGDERKSPSRKPINTAQTGNIDSGACLSEMARKRTGGIAPAQEMVVRPVRRRLK